MDAPPSVRFRTEGFITGGGPEERIESFIAEHPDTTLIIIDTLRMVRGTGYDNTYANDYRDLSVLKKLADKHGVAILLIHHLRKEGADDVFKQCCREFAKRQGWEVIKELSEKGVSGFKVSAKDRDAIQKIQQDAAQGMFDVLLVYMFDRLGRREDETPFVAEWFVRNGIKVWSTVEGRQRCFDNHVETKSALEKLKEDLAKAQTELDDCQGMADNIRAEYNRILTWADMYEGSSIEARKMILRRIIKKVYIGRNYEVRLELSISLAEYQRLYLGEKTA